MKLLFIFLFLNVFTFAQTVTIPDAIFKNYLINNASININGDTEIQVSEANSFTGVIDCFNLSISDMSGIESFINLTQLKFANNQVTSIDLSLNVNLTLLYCDYNQLTQLDLSSNTALYNLSCYDNSITSLDLSNNTNLGQLECSLNNIDSLNLSTNVNLTKILCHTNSLHYLNVANGNNQSIQWINFNAQWNPNLNCVQVDDTTYSNQSWDNRISPPGVYSLNCGQTTSISTKNENSSIHIFPNPATNSIILDTHFSINDRVNIYNSLGVLITNIELTESNTINIESLKSGLYFLKLESQNKIYGKFIKT